MTIQTDEVTLGGIEHLPKTRIIVLPCAGHVPQLEQPALVAAEIKAFLQQLVHLPNNSSPALQGVEASA